MSFPNFNLWPLAWIALVPLLFAIEGLRPRKAFALAYLTGVLFFLGTIYWLIHVTLPGMLAVVLYLALYFGLFGIFFHYRLPVTGYRLLYLPSLWVALEWVRSHLFTGFGWAILAHSQGFNLPIIQIADITGAYGVSFLIVLVNTAVYLVIKSFIKRKYSIMPLVIAAALIFASLYYGYFRLNNIFTGEILKVSVVQGNIPQVKKWDERYRGDIIAKYSDLTREAAREGPDLVVWPEASVPGFLESERELLEWAKKLAGDIKTPLLVGTPKEDPKKEYVYYNSAVLFSEDGRIIGGYDKLHLVPFGEYIPFKEALSFIQRFSTMPIGDFAPGKDLTVFKFIIERKVKDRDVEWKLIKRVRFSCLVCFEDIFPELARAFVREGALFLVNITNDAWFGKTAAAYQHAQCSVFRAVENRVNVVRAANTGLSCFIDQKGKIVDLVSEGGSRLFVDGFKSCDIVLTKTRTFYNANGDVFTYLCIICSVLMIAAVGFIRIIKRYQKELL